MDGEPGRVQVATIMEKRKRRPRPSLAVPKDEGKPVAGKAPELASGSKEEEEVEASYTLRSPAHVHQ